MEIINPDFLYISRIRDQSIITHNAQKLFNKHEKPISERNMPRKVHTADIRYPNPSPSEIFFLF